MKNPVVDKKMSKWVAEIIDSKPDNYFMNALLGMHVLPEQENVRFCFGYYRNINSKERFVFEHAWIEYNDTIIDPSLVVHGISKLEDYTYIRFIRLTLEEIEGHRAHCIDNPDGMIGFNLFGYVLYDKEKYDDFIKGMKIIEGIDYMCVDKETIIKLALYIDIKDPIDELTYENILVKSPIEKAG
jgi:hypothetical protein